MDISVSFAANGAITLDYNGHRYISAQLPEFSIKKTSDVNLSVKNPTFDIATKTYTRTFDGGTITAQCIVSAKRLTFTYQVHNVSQPSILGSAFALYPIFPAAHVGLDGAGPFPRVVYSRQRPGLSSHVLSTGSRVDWCCDNSPSDLEVLLSLHPWPISTSLQRRALLCDYDKVANVHIPFNPAILTGQSSPVYTCSLRFDDSVTDINDAFRATYPFQRLTGCDNRAIVRWIHVGQIPNTATNPNGWQFHDGGSSTPIDVTTPQGLAAFRTIVLNSARARLARMEQVGTLGAQGVIMWQIEGNRSPGFAYVGDPRITYINAPEWAYETNGVKLVNEFFNVFKEVGMRVGVTLRKGKITVDPVTFSMSADRTVDEAQDYIDKIAYAKKEWGCSLIYIDSSQEATSGPVMEAVFRAHPDVLLLPEYSSVRAFASASAHRSGTQNGIKVTQTHPQVRDVYSHALTFVSITNSGFPAQLNDPAVLANYVKIIRDGDGILITAHYDTEPGYASAKKIYSAAGM